MIKNFSRITKIVQVSAMKVHFQIAERSLFYLNPDIQHRRMTYPPERGGCYGITNSDNDYSNDYSNRIIDSIINQSRKSKKEKNKIEVIIEKRNSNERPKSINVIIK